jgi:hypothetical protein
VAAVDADVSRKVNVAGHDNCVVLGYYAASRGNSRRKPEGLGHVLYEILNFF